MPAIWLVFPLIRQGVDFLLSIEIKDAHEAMGNVTCKTTAASHSQNYKLYWLLAKPAKIKLEVIFFG